MDSNVKVELHLNIKFSLAMMKKYIGWSRLSTQKNLFEAMIGVANKMEK
jgi:hypothetical protein